MNNFILYIILFLYIMDNLITQLSNILFLVRKDLPSQKYKDMYDIIHKIKIIHDIILLYLFFDIILYVIVFSYLILFYIIFV